MKLHPGDTFPHEQDGITYQIKVMSVGDRMDCDAMIDQAKEAATNRAYIAMWLEIVEKYVSSWSHDEPLDRLRYTVTEDGLYNLWTAVLMGNQTSEDDQKN